MGPNLDLKPASPHVALECHPAATPVRPMEATNADASDCVVPE
jgi:hypothetical protein